MEVKAVAKYMRVQPRKVRIIADEIRGKSALHAAALLRYHTSKGAKYLRKVLINAMANAQENNNLSAETLVIHAITVDEGPRLKRMKARAMGRGNRIIKKTSHITVVVEDQEPKAAVKPHGTKAKARPTFAAPKGKKNQGPTVATPVATSKAKASAAAEDIQPVEVEATEAAVVETAASVVEEATPVTESEAPEETGSTAEVAAAEATPEAEATEDKKEKS
jgi:large subunit ribosomal protein L22